MLCSVLKANRKISRPPLVIGGGADNLETVSNLHFFLEENEICVCLAVMGQRQNAGSVP